VNASQLLPAVRDIYSRHPEFRDLEPWELQHVIWSVHYSDDLEDEATIAAAMEVARMDFTGERGDAA
jgi:hypothetical protein